MIFKKVIVAAAPLMTLIPIVSCANGEITDDWREADPELLRIFNSYTETYQKSFWDAVDQDESTKRQIINSTGLVCSSPFDAVLLWTYYPGYQEWNTLLHQHKWTELEDTTVLHKYMTIPDPADPYKKQLSTTAHFSRANWHLLQQAINLSTVGISTHSFHGFEPDECDLVNFIQENLGYDVTKTKKSDLEDDSLTNIIGKSYDNYGFYATTMDERYGAHYGETWKEDHILPLIEMNIDPSVNGIYLSYDAKKFYDGFFFSWPWEYQLLLQSGTRITVTGARWVKTTSNNDIMWLNCEVKKIVL